MEQIKKTVIVDTSEVPSLLTIYGKLLATLDSSKSERYKNVQEIINSERQKARHAVEKVDYCRKRKHMEDLDEFDKQIHHLVSKRSKQTASVEKVLDQIRLILDKMENLNKKSTVINDSADFYESAEVFIESERKISAEYMESQEGIIKALFDAFEQSIHQMLLNTPSLVRQRDSFANLDSTARKEAELLWNLSVIKRLDGFNPLDEKIDLLQRENKKLQQVNADILKTLAAKKEDEDKLSQDIEKINDDLYSFDDEMHQIETKENERLQELYEETIQVHLLTDKRNMEYFSFKDQLLEGNGLEEEKKKLAEHLNNLDTKFRDLEVDLDCVKADLAEQCDSEMKLEKQLEDDRQRSRDDDDSAEKAYEDLLKQHHEIDREITLLMEKTKSSKNKLSEENTGNEMLKSELEELTTNVNSFKKAQEEKKRKRRALKSEYAAIDSEITQLMIEL